MKGKTQVLGDSVCRVTVGDDCGTEARFPLLSFCGQTLKLAGAVLIGLTSGQR